MSKPKRSKAARNAKYQKWKNAQVQSCEDGKAGATGGKAEAMIPQSAATDSTSETAFKPEILSPENVAIYSPAGRGSCRKDPP